MAPLFLAKQWKSPCVEIQCTVNPTLKTPRCQTPHYCGQELKSRRIRNHKINSRYYGLGLLRRPNHGPGGIHYSASSVTADPGGGTSYKWANGDVPLDGVAFSRLD